MQKSLFDPEFKQTTHINVSKNRKNKQWTEMIDLEESFVSKQGTLEKYDNNNNNGNKNVGPSCKHSPRRIAHITWTQMNVRQIIMKIAIL